MSLTSYRTALPREKVERFYEKMRFVKIGSTFGYFFTGKSNQKLLGENELGPDLSGFGNKYLFFMAFGSDYVGPEQSSSPRPPLCFQEKPVRLTSPLVIFPGANFGVSREY